MSDTISRQDAIDTLKEEEYPCESDYDEGYMAALDKAVWIIEKWLPSAQQETHDKHTETHDVCLDAISRQAAIDAINTWDKFGVDERGRLVRWHEGLEPYVHLRDVLTAIVNLPSEQPKQTDCEFCHEDFDGYVRPIEKNSHAVIYGSALHLKANGWRGKVQIKYCPMCGRRLER